jgi:hypothetical protein
MNANITGGLGTGPIRMLADHAVDIARHDPPPGLSPEAAVAAIREVLDSIGDTCPECPPD